MLKKESLKRKRLGQATIQQDGAKPIHEMAPDFFKARWTGSKEGLVASGWSKAGIERFNQHARMIKERRAHDTGLKFEEHLRDYWRGRVKNPRKRKPRQEIVAAFEEDIFEGFHEITNYESM